MTTQEIIESLREIAAMPDYVPVREMHAAADRLEELQRLQTDRDLMILVGRRYARVVEKERDEARAEVERLKADKQTRPEPSRLEIAAMVMQGFIADGNWNIIIAARSLEYADALIAAAKGEK
jgi:hypothetical protein